MGILKCNVIWNGTLGSPRLIHSSGLLISVSGISIQFFPKARCVLHPHIPAHSTSDWQVSPVSSTSPICHFFPSPTLYFHPPPSFIWATARASSLVFLIQGQKPLPFSTLLSTQRDVLRGEISSYQLPLKTNQWPPIALKIKPLFLPSLQAEKSFHHRRIVSLYPSPMSGIPSNASFVLGWRPDSLKSQVIPSGPLRPRSRSATRLWFLCSNLSGPVFIPDPLLP